MTPNKRDLKAYARFDGTGRIVPGSTVLRRNKPKVGTWIEVQAYECCNSSGGCIPLEAIGVADVSQPDLFSTTYNAVSVFISCRDVLPDFPTSGVVFINLVGPLPNFSFSNWSDIINFLNTNYGSIGTFSYLGGISVQLITNTEYIPCINPEVQIEFSTS
jgi:hypothetical protein